MKKSLLFLFLLLIVTVGCTAFAGCGEPNYTVSFDLNGGSGSVEAQVVTEGSDVTKPTDPTREGYTFLGWYVGDDEWSFNGNNVSKDIILIAKWQPRKDIPYIVNHYQQNAVDDGYMLADVDAFVGTADETVTPAVKNYAGFVTPDTQSITVKPDGTLVVDYYYAREIFIIQFVTNGGESIAPLNVKYGAIFSADMQAKRDGYTFGGWYSDAELTSAYTSSLMVNSDIVLYAYWQEEDKPSKYEYRYIETSNSVIITGYTGGQVANIPAYIGGFPVTGLNDWAFERCTELVIVRMPDSVTSIGGEAFSNCTSLSSVTISSGVTFIGRWAFSGCKNLRYNEYGNAYYLGNADNPYVVCMKPTSDSITSCEIHPNTKTISDGAFEYCTGLTNITIPDSVTSIGFAVFEGCTGLTSVTIGNGVTSIGAGAFCNCTGLTNITIPDSVTSIGSSAFRGCTGLTSITIPDSVTSIGDHAFEDCKELTSITIPDSVTSIGYEAFSGCKNLRYNEYDNVYYLGNIKNPYIVSVKAITPYITVCIMHPNSKIIYDNTFEDCKELTSIIIPDGVTSIGKHAFENCMSLKSITIPDSVTSIGYAAFGGCTGLESITLPFVGKTLNGTSDTQFDYIFGDNVPASLKTVVITGGESIGESAFYGCTGLESITIPDSITSIGAEAFYKCTGLTNITISDSVTSIGAEAFYKCTRLTSVTIGNGVTSIGDDALSYCTGLTNITIPDSVTSIGSYAFHNCTGLTSVTIGNGVTSIGAYAFFKCTGLTSVTIGNGVTSIGDCAFYECTGLTNITIPDSITSIGKSAFEDCKGLMSITIPDSVTSIGSYAFNNCTGLTSVTIGNGVTSIGSYAFFDCTGLISIAIPDSVTSIGSCAFSGCTGLTRVTIGNGVTSIDMFAFSDCTNLKHVVFENTSGWSAGSKSVSTSDLSNAETEAAWLKEYENKEWKRN